MADLPAYDVVIPAWNAAATLAEAIRSVIGQTIPPARIIVVDDGSTDTTAQVASGFPGVVLVRQQNAGPGAATMAGEALTAASLIATLDADDLWLPEKMQRQLAFMQANAGCAAVFGRLQKFRDGNLVGDPEDGWSRTTMLARRSLFDAIGPIIDPPGRRGEMIDWLARAREGGHSLVMLPDVVARRRIHESSLTFVRDASKDAGYLHIARQAILRRRAALAGKD